LAISNYCYGRKYITKDEKISVPDSCHAPNQLRGKAAHRFPNIVDGLANAGKYIVDQSYGAPGRSIPLNLHLSRLND
jgi:hypothetical protein